MTSQHKEGVHLVCAVCSHEPQNMQNAPSQFLYPVLKSFAHGKKKDLHYLVTSAKFLDSSICPSCGLPLFGLTSCVSTVTFLLVAQSWNAGS